MDTATLMLGSMALLLAGVAWHAWRLGNERRDVVLLGVIAASLGAGGTVTALA